MPVTGYHEEGKGTSKLADTHPYQAHMCSPQRTLWSDFTSNKSSHSTEWRTFCKLPALA